VGAPIPVDIIDVIAIPRLTLLFGGRLLYTSGGATAKGCHENSKRSDDFEPGKYLLHMSLQCVIVPVPMYRQRFNQRGAFVQCITDTLAPADDFEKLDRRIQTFRGENALLANLVRSKAQSSALRTVGNSRLQSPLRKQSAKASAT
jgi:hypothetical protein